uniref:Uncharacterized protein n=1 Tax=Chromera velia CCMP2878 TaxID=1169474 RepID=A0A0G4F0I1_9ALVE|eukprot:Cvel_14481.t1-p1 / transcript=Cvel_14481.t1 / gene=Cvel_14481 / organism=Chromera_velia_CCMP2878 / gene_product=hypothetical protein / transcript_product=hypothetical protein / location=Cvel_scaffold1032:11924-15970(-) / protein_length=866 / sequence_SO=supercontig / SO=protein_coding / is_pseudo=false
MTDVHEGEESAGTAGEVSSVSSSDLLPLTWDILNKCFGDSLAQLSAEEGGSIATGFLLDQDGDLPEDAYPEVWPEGTQQDDCGATSRSEDETEYEEAVADYVRALIETVLLSGTDTEEAGSESPELVISQAGSRGATSGGIGTAAQTKGDGGGFRYLTPADERRLARERAQRAAEAARLRALRARERLRQRHLRCVDFDAEQDKEPFFFGQAPPGVIRLCQNATARPQGLAALRQTLDAGVAGTFSTNTGGLIGGKGESFAPPSSLAGFPAATALLSLLRHTPLPEPPSQSPRKGSSPTPLIRDDRGRRHRPFVTRFRPLDALASRLQFVDREALREPYVQQSMVALLMRSYDDIPREGTQQGSFKGNKKKESEKEEGKTNRKGDTKEADENNDSPTETQKEEDEGRDPETSLSNDPVKQSKSSSYLPSCRERRFTPRTKKKEPEKKSPPRPRSERVPFFTLSPKARTLLVSPEDFLPLPLAEALGDKENGYSPPGGLRSKEQNKKNNPPKLHPRDFAAFAKVAKALDEAFETRNARTKGEQLAKAKGEEGEGGEQKEGEGDTKSEESSGGEKDTETKRQNQHRDSARKNRQTKTKQAGFKPRHTIPSLSLLPPVKDENGQPKDAALTLYDSLAREMKERRRAAKRAELLVSQKLEQEGTDTHASTDTLEEEKFPPHPIPPVPPSSRSGRPRPRPHSLAFGGTAHMDLVRLSADLSRTKGGKAKGNEGPESLATAALKLQREAAAREDTETLLGQRPRSTSVVKQEDEDGKSVSSAGKEAGGVAAAPEVSVESEKGLVSEECPSSSVRTVRRLIEEDLAALNCRLRTLDVDTDAIRAAHGKTRAEVFLSHVTSVPYAAGRITVKQG